MMHSSAAPTFFKTEIEMMMKLTLTAASFSLAMLSFNAAYAGGDHKHHATQGASMEMHDEHASTMGKPGNPAKVTRLLR